jgi:hypothetical protein
MGSIPTSADGQSAEGDLMQIHYRDEEAIYVRAAHDRVTVVFSTVFREETDRIFGKLFLQVRQVPIRADAAIDNRRCVGIRRCETAAVYPDCAPGFVHEQRATSGNQKCARTQRFGGDWLRHLWWEIIISVY